MSPRVETAGHLPSLNAFVFTAFDEARDRAKKAERALTSGQPLGLRRRDRSPVELLDAFIHREGRYPSPARRADGDQRFVCSKPEWLATLGGIRSLKASASRPIAPEPSRWRRRVSTSVDKTNSPVMGFRGTCDNYLFGPSAGPSSPCHLCRPQGTRRRGRCRSGPSTFPGERSGVPRSACGS